MPKEVTRVEPGDVAAAIAGGGEWDEVDRRILDAAVDHLQHRGFDGFEVDAIAAAAGIGRSTIYRRFAGRNALIANAIAFETRRFFEMLAASVDDIDDPVDQAVAAFATGLRWAQRSGLVDLVRREPLLLQLLTVHGGPAVDAAVAQLTLEVRRRQPSVDPGVLQPAVESLVRLAVSFVLIPGRFADLDEVGDDLEDRVRRFVEPVVAPLGNVRRP